MATTILDVSTKGRFLKSPIKGMKTFTYGDAVRVYIWNKGWAKGYKRIPGLNMPQKFRLIAIVNKDKKLREFANKASQISKQPNGWIEPYEGWTSRTISSEIKNNLKSHIENRK